jgi:hypothetical protein
LPVKAVPSLQVAVTVFVSCAWLAHIGRKRPAIVLALALLVGWRAWLRSVDPIQDPQPRERDYVIQAIERLREETLIQHVLF